MTETRGSARLGRGTPKRLLGYVRQNPQMGLSAALFCSGALTVTHYPPVGGALFGAGASMLGAWITELHNRASASETKTRLQREARQYLAPELHRTIDRVLYIHDRAISKFIGASAGRSEKTGDIKEDFLPYWPILYPTAQQFRDLPGEEAIALVNFYDSLHTVGAFVNDWWEREGQLPVNIFNQIVHGTEKSLKLALICMRNFDLDTMIPPPYQSWSLLSVRIERSLASGESAREHHIKRASAQSANKAGG